MAERVGKGRSTITNSLRLLNLPEVMLDGLERGHITPGHARALLSVKNPADQEILYARIIDEDLSVRQAEALADDLNNGTRAVKKVPQKDDMAAVSTKAPEILSMEEKFLSATGYRVEIKGKYKNGGIKKGKILIPFKSDDELEAIYQLLAPGSDLYD